jgi:hypothetical protein
VAAAHLDYDTLAELAEGLLSDARAASAEVHLENCAECQNRSAEIADVSRLLADAPVPPMPAELASRIDEALAAEAATSSAPAGPVMSLAAVRRYKRLRILSVAAATVAVLGGGAVVGHSLLTGPVPSESGTAQSKAVQDPSASSRPKAPRSETLQGAAGGYLTVQSGTNYTADRLGAQVSAQVTQGESGRAAMPPTRTVAACVQRVTQGKPPLLVDIASYEGRPATLIVLPTVNSGRLDIWVVGPACSASDTALLKRAQTAR